MKKFCSKAVAKHQKLNNKLQKSIKKPRKEGGRTSDNRPYRKFLENIDKSGRIFYNLPRNINQNI